MYTKRKGIRTKKHRHSAHHPGRKHRSSIRHKHSAHHRKRSSTKKKRSRRTRKYRKRMSGGMASYAEAYIPDAANGFENGLRSLGNSYNAGDAGLPSGNHYAYNSNVKAAPIPSNHIAQIGGRKHKCKCKGKCKCKNKSKGKHMRHYLKKQNGGNVGSFITKLLPEEIVNVGRSVPAAFGHLSDKFNGELSHPSSMVYPTEQPHVYSNDDRGSLIQSNTMSITDIKSAYDVANGEVAGM
jgi:hypothetical protein